MDLDQSNESEPDPDPDLDQDDDDMGERAFPSTSGNSRSRPIKHRIDNTTKQG